MFYCVLILFVDFAPCEPNPTLKMKLYELKKKKKEVSANWEEVDLSKHKLMRNESECSESAVISVKSEEGTEPTRLCFSRVQLLSYTTCTGFRQL